MLAPAVASNASSNNGLGYLPVRTNSWSEGGPLGQSVTSGGVPQTANASAQLVSEYYSSDSLFLNYTNADGDSVSLAIEHVEYQKAMVSFAGNADSEEWKKIVDFIKDEFQRMHQEMIDRFIESINGKKAEKNEETQVSDTSSTIPGLPEYWNAENTSQRIVDFAVSFYGLYEGTGSEYFDMIKAAIDDGFSQARDLVGELPTEVEKLVSDTYDLVMQKLDAWAKEQGIAVEEPEQAA